MRGASERVAVHAYSSDLNTDLITSRTIASWFDGFFFSFQSLLFLLCCLFVFWIGMPLCPRAVDLRHPFGLLGSTPGIRRREDIWNSSHMRLIGPRPNHSENFKLYSPVKYLNTRP